MDGSDALRWHQLIECIDLNSEEKLEDGCYFIGFCCDEGVRRNKGRVGSEDGPKFIRQAMCNLAGKSKMPRIFDAGDVFCHDEQLEDAQEIMSGKIARLVSKGRLPIVLGGGHETAWASYLGLRKAIGSDPRIGIINIDAHFDLRPVKHGANSGTPFRQMADWSKQYNVPFDYFILGIQPASNTTALFNYANENNVEYITADNFAFQPLEYTSDRLEVFMTDKDLIYLTIDLDVFDAAFAPGVSATKSLGMLPQQLIPVLNTISGSGKIRLVDVCECNPRLDVANMTSKLAAALIYRIISFIS